MPISRGVRWFAKGSLMVLAIWWGSSYLINRALHPPATPPEASKPAIEEHPTNEAKFQSLLDSGNQAFRNGQYQDALDRFLEAEQSGERLTDEQYQALKNSRLQLAQTYENGGDNLAAQRVYHALYDCALRQGQAWFRVSQFDRAVTRGQDAEELSGHLTEGRRDALQYAIYLLRTSLVELQRYPEAAQAQVRMIDYLKATVDGDDWAFGSSYESLAEIYSKGKDWPDFEHALLYAIEACDRTLEHPPTDNSSIADAALRTKNVAQYNLVIAYYREGNTEAALSKADDLFAEYPPTPPDPMHPLTVQFHSRDFATLALQIATEAKRPNDIDRWREKGGIPSGGVSVGVFRPASTH
jgi:tetratricopeptide (TPR) repeat protein